MTTNISAEAARTSTEHPFPRRALVGLWLIAVAAAGVRAYLFRGYGGLDDGEYARFAALMADGRQYPANYEGPAVFPLRVGLILPAAIGFRMFGITE